MTNSVILFMNARDEYNIEEWVAYHLLIGFDQIVIFDHLSEIPINSIMSKYSFPQLTIHRVNDKSTIKWQFMNMAYEIAQTRNIQWLIYLDADEYLVLRKHGNIHDFINEYSSLNSIGINWVIFGSNYHDSNPSKFLIDDFTLCENTGDHRVKTLVKVSTIQYGVPHPHFWSLKHNIQMYTTHKIPMEIGPFNSTTKGIQDPAYIHHYSHQSYDTFIRRKVNRRRDDVYKARPYVSKDQFHSTHNQDKETYLYDHYSSKIKEFLLEHTKK